MPVNPTLPTPGGDDGTWGDELNAALGVIVDGINAEETARAAADTALDARVDVVEATLPTLATTASVTALDGRVDVLEAAPSGTYPPVGGVPEADLASAVQTKLNAVGASSAEPVTAVPASGTAQTFTLPGTGLATWDVTLTGNCTLSFAGATAGKLNVITAILRQDATGGRGVTFPASVRWPNGLAPVLSTAAGRADVVSFLSADAGTTWLGSVVGVAFSSPPAATAPGQVTGLAATPGDQTVSLSWTAPSSGGSAITDYVIQRSPAGANTWVTVTDGVSSGTSYIDSGRTNGTALDYRVAAVNAVGQGAYSATVTATPAAPVSTDPGMGARYLNLTGASGAFADTPHLTAYHHATQIGLRARAQLADWTPAATTTLLAKWGASASGQQYILQVTATGALRIAWKTSTTVEVADSTVPVGAADGTPKWVRVDLDIGTADTADFYTSDDGVTWTQLGTTVSVAAASQGGIPTPSAPVSLSAGAVAAGTPAMTGRLYFTQLLAAGTAVSTMDWSKATAGATTHTATTGETWTVRGAASVL